MNHMNESAQPVVTALAMNAQTLDLAFGAFSALGHFGDGMSLYAYAGSNPVNRRDPLGLYDDPFEEVDDIIGSMYAENVAFGQDMLNSFGFLAKTGAFIGQMAIESMIVAMVPGGAFIVSGYHLAHAGMDMYENGISFWNSFEMVASAVPFAKGLVSGFRKGLSALRGMRAPRGCFVAGTLVWMADGTLLPIEQVRAGEEVMTRGCDIGQVELARVLDTHFYETGGTLRICVGDEADCLNVTAEHPFWVEGRGWTPAGDLRVGDRLIDAAGAPTAISAVTTHVGATTVYNLSVGGSQTFYVTSDLLLVHNKPVQVRYVPGPNGFSQVFDRAEDAIGPTGIGGVRRVGGGKTNSQNIRDEGFTETHYYADSEGTQWTVFYNPAWRVFGGAHPSSSNR